MNETTQTTQAPTLVDIVNLKEFIMWAKENKVQLHTVNFGSMSLTLTDLEILNTEEEEEYTPRTDVSPKTMHDEMALRRGLDLSKGGF